MSDADTKAPRYDLVVFPTDSDGTYVTISSEKLAEYGTAGKVSSLPKEAQALYELMCSSDVDAAHVPFPAAPQTADRVMIFGTFYINLAAFK
ncbi:MAG: hypothetical protein ABI867_34515 [Kofleriaceae bacterium]